MSGIHFGIVLSKNDTQYNKTVLVIPLSSHKGRNRVYLGKDVLHKAQLSMDKEKDEIKQEIFNLEYEINNLDYNLKSFIKDNNITSTEKLHKLIADNNYNGDLLKIISQFKSYNHQLQLIQDKIDKEQKRLYEFKQELDRLDNYNNNSYACLESISSISKLKIKKFSKYGIHSNISINPENLNLIKQNIKDFIDID